MLTISVLHKIFLTREERYALHEGHAVRVIGTSVPTWFDGDNNSEPSQEIFCEYTLMNCPGSRPVTPIQSGYTIHLPQGNELMPKMVNPVSGTTSQEMMKPPTSANLLDLNDGGSQSLHFKQYTKLRTNQEQPQLVNLLHFVEIEDISVVENTITDNT